MILPTIIRTTQESLKTVPASYREGALGLGATKWYMIRTIVLPSSISGIVTAVFWRWDVSWERVLPFCSPGSATIIADNILEAYTRGGGTLSVALYMYASERAEFDVPLPSLPFC